jgi:hypothetical protein
MTSTASLITRREEQLASRPAVILIESRHRTRNRNLPASMIMASSNTLGAAEAGFFAALRENPLRVALAIAEHLRLRVPLR